MFSLHKRIYKVEKNLQIIEMMSTLEASGYFKNLKEAFIYFFYITMIILYLNKYFFILHFLKRVLFYILQEQATHFTF